MIKSWFTQPKGGKNSSYYQYDTSTRELVRVRLELSRNSLSGKTNDTAAFYTSDRAVGFSKTALTFNSKDPGTVWSVKDGEICYKGTALPGPPPEPGVNVYDTTNPNSYVHAGNPVCTDPPILPTGIKSEHLALLANDALVRMTTITLTDGGVSADVLAAKIKSEVCRIVGQPDFAKINDDMILAKLTDQAKTISGMVASDDRSSLNDALKAARQAYSEVNAQIDDGVLVPTEDFNKAFAALDSALTTAQSASNGGNVKDALAQITSAQDAVVTAVKNIDIAKNATTKDQLDSASKSLSAAQEHASEWQDTETEYEPLSKATSVQDYMDKMSAVD